MEKRRKQALLGALVFTLLAFFKGWAAESPIQYLEINGSTGGPPTLGGYTIGRITGDQIQLWRSNNAPVTPTTDWRNGPYTNGSMTATYVWGSVGGNGLLITGDATYNTTTSSTDALTWSETIRGLNNSIIYQGSTKSAGSIEMHSGSITISGDANLNGTNFMATAKNGDTNLDGIAGNNVTSNTSTTVSLSNMTNAAGFNGTLLLQSDINVVNIGSGANVNRTGSNANAGKMTVSGAVENRVNFNLAHASQQWTFSGQVDLSDTATDGAVNVVTITSGRLDRSDAAATTTTASIIGSEGDTTYNIDGGTVRTIDTNGGNARLINSNGRFDFMNPSGTVGGINAQNYNTRDYSAATKETITGNNSTEEYNAGQYLVYTLLNVGDTVTVNTGADVRVGVIDYNDNDDGALTNLNRYKFEAQSLTSDAFDAINSWDYSANTAYSGPNALEAQITANKVDVHGTLVIHENIYNWGKDKAAIAADDTHNIINTLTVKNGGKVTIDRSSIHGTGAGGAQVDVDAGGTLFGFGHFGGNTTGPNNSIVQPGSDIFGEKTPVRSNVDGSVTLAAGAVNAGTGRVQQAGGRIQPYNTDLFTLGWGGLQPGIGGGPAYRPGETETDAVEKLMGVVFRTENKFEFKETSFLSTRLFAEFDATGNPNEDIRIDGNKPLHYSDAVLANELVFADVLAAVTAPALGNGSDLPIRNTLQSKIAQSTKVQYDPVFGLHNELKSKLDFKLYEGGGITNDKQTYYFNVASSENVIAELAGYDDANHLFNRMILKSDMLGEWTFLYDWDETTSTGQHNIILRYRMLAEHPQNGGLVIRETERNNILVAKYLDEIRYPFVTDTSMLNLPKDYAGDIVGLDYDSSSVYDKDGNYSAHSDDPADKNELDRDWLIYNNKGYTGDMVQWYRDNLPTPATQWKDEYMMDWEDLLHAFQLELQDGGKGMSRGLRMLHAEPYANLSESNFNVMGQFIRNRERNSVSALYEVENPDYPRDFNEVDTMFDPVLDAGRMDRFVQNPIRFWASGFGTTGSGRKSGTEYGFDQEIWGGSLGVVKEFGDLYGGLTVGYARAHNTWDDIPSGGTTKSYMAEALIGYRLPGMFFGELYADYSYGEQKMSRHFDIANYYTGTATGDFNDHLYAGGLRFGWQKPFWGSWLFLPTVGFQVMHYRAGAFTETGRANMAPLLKVHDGWMNRTMYKVPMMARVSRAWAINDTMVLTPEFRAGITPIFGNTRGKVKAEWVGNPFPDRTFVSYGVDRGRYEAEIGATIELSRKGRFYVAGNYDLVYSKNNTMHNYSIQAGWNF